MCIEICGVDFGEGIVFLVDWGLDCVDDVGFCYVVFFWVLWLLVFYFLVCFIVGWFDSL